MRKKGKKRVRVSGGSSVFFWYWGAVSRQAAAVSCVFKIFEKSEIYHQFSWITGLDMKLFVVFVLIV